MSNIDERIVKMTFDNQMFEKNVATSIKTLNDLKAAMNFDNATASLGNIEKTIGNVNFSKLEAGIDNITKRFSTLGIVGMTAIQDLTRSVEHLVFSKATSLYNSTFGQIKTGGWNRATNIDKARFAVEGLKLPWNELEKSISAAVNDTRFGFDEAATAASQLAASNVQLGDDMDNALKSIANVASQTGAEYSEIGHIYTVIAGNGKLMTEQMQQFSYRGFNAAAAMASVWGKTEAEVREMVSKGEVDFKEFSDAMNEYLGEGAQRANSTFEGSMANMKAALSRIGQPFAKSYRDAMIPVFNTLKELIKDIKGRIEPLEKIFEDFAQKASHLATGLIGKIDLSFVDWIVDKLQKAYNWFDGVMSKVTPLWSKVTEVADKASDTAKTVVETADYVDEMAQKFIRGDYGNGVEKRRAAMEELGYSYEKIQNRVNELLGCSYRYDVAEEEATKTTEKNTEATKENAEAIKKSNSMWDEQVSFIQNAKNVIATWPKKIADAFSSVIDKDSAINKLATAFAGIKSAFEIVGKTALSLVDGALGPVASAAAHIVNIILTIGQVIGSLFINLNKLLHGLGFYDLVKTAATTIGNFLNFIAAGIDNVINLLSKPLIAAFEVVGNAAEFLRGGFENFFGSIKASDEFKNLRTQLLAVGEAIKDFGKNTIDKVRKKFENFFETIKRSDAMHNLHISFMRLKINIRNFLEKGGITTLITRFKNLFETIKRSDAMHNLHSSFNRLKRTLKNTAKQGFETLKNSFDSLMKKMKDKGIKLPIPSFNKLGKAVSKVAESILDFLSKLLGKIDIEKFIESVVDGLAQVIDFITNLATVIKGFLGKAFDYISDKFKAFINWIKESTGGIEGIKESLKDNKALSSFGDLIDNIGKNLKSAKDSVVNWVKETAESIKNGTFELPKIDLEGVKEGFNDVLDWIIKKLEEIRDYITNFFSNLEIPGFSDLFKTEDKKVEETASPISGLLGNLNLPNQEQIDKASAGLQGYYDKFKGIVPSEDQLKNIRASAEESGGIFASIAKYIPSKEQLSSIESTVTGITGGMEQMGPLLPSQQDVNTVKTANEETKGFFDGIKEMFPSFEEIEGVVGFVKNIAISFATMKGALGISNTMWNVGKTVGKVAETVKSFNSVLDNLSNGIKRISKAKAKLDKAQARNLNATALLKVAAAIGVVALSLKLLSTISQDKLEGVTTAIIVIAGALGILYIAVSRFAGGKGGKGKASTQVTDIGQAIESLGKNIGKGLKKIGTAAMILAFVHGVKSIIEVVKDLKDMSWYEAQDAVKIIGAIMLELAGSMAIMNVSGIGGSFGKNIGQAALMLSYIYGIKSIVNALKELSGIEEADLDKARRTLESFMGLMTIFATLSKPGKLTNREGGLFGKLFGTKKQSTNGKSVVGPMLAMIGSILAITYSLKTLSKIDEGDLKNARNAISVIEILTSLLVATFSDLADSMGGLTETINENGKLNFGVAVLGMIGILAGIIGAFVLLDKAGVQDPAQIVSTTIAISRSVRAIAVLAKTMAEVSETELTLAAVGASLGWVGIATAVVALAGIIASLIDLIPGAQEFMHGGAEILKEFGGWIGEFIGGLIGGIIDGIVDFVFGDIGESFDALPGKLTAFMEGLQPFIDAVNGIETDGVDAFIKIVTALAGVFALETLDAMFEWLTGESSFSKFSTGLTDFANALVGYSDIIEKNPISEKAVESSGRAADIILKLAAKVPNNGGVIGWFMGENNINEFGHRMKGFAEGIRDYSDVFEANPVSEDVVESSGRAADIILKLAAKVPNNGGVIGWFMGENNINEFGKRMKGFAEGIRDYSDVFEANPIDEKAVESSGRAADIIVDLSNKVPNSGGLYDMLMGNNDIDKFGERLGSFADSLINFSDKVKKEGAINNAAVENAKAMGDILVALENSISDQGGLISELLFGDSSIDSFGTRLETFGESLVNFSSILSGDYGVSGTKVAMAFQPEVVEGVIGTIQKLVDFANVISDSDYDKFEENMYALEGIEMILLNQLQHLGELLGAEDSDYQKSFEDIGKKVIEGLNTGIQNALGEDDKGQSKSLATALVEGLTDESFISKIKTESETVGSTIAGAIAGITDEDGELTAFTEGLITSFTEMLNTVSTSVEGQATEFIDVGIRWAAGIATGLRTNTAVNSVNQAARSLGNSALTALRGMSSSFSSIGSGWASSLTSGLSSSQTRLTQSARTLGTSTGQAFTTAYQTATSNVFSTTGTRPGTTGTGTGDGDGVGPKAEKAGKAIGEFVSKGIVEGSEKNVDSFASSVTTMAAYANAVMNEALDTNPVITPVLDMSNVQANAGLMNNYLNDSFSMGANASSYTSSLLSGVSIKQYDDTQNQMNALATQEALNGIRQDIKDLGESMSHMQMVMNNGALVGQIGRGMDKQLGSIQKFKERWA